LIRNLAEYLTSTIGLICTRHEDGINIMAAEWTYFVSKEPPQAAVVISNETFTQANALSAGEFSVTLCSADQASLADFAGSVSGRDIDKTTSELVELCEPVAISTPWVGGGVASLECQMTQVVDLPGYQMLIGEVLAIHADEAKLGNPLVKHGAMYSLGAPIHYAAVVAAAEFRPGPRPCIRVAAAGHAPDESAMWQVFLDDGRGRTVSLGSAAPTDYDDLLASFEIPKAAAGWNLSVAEVLVCRDGLKTGRARVSCRPDPARSLPRLRPGATRKCGGPGPAPRGQTKQKALIAQRGGVIEDAEARP